MSGKDFIFTATGVLLVVFGFVFIALEIYRVVQVINNP